MQCNLNRHDPLALSTSQTSDDEENISFPSAGLLNMMQENQRTSTISDHPLNTNQFIQSNSLVFKPKHL